MRRVWTRVPRVVRTRSSLFMVSTSLGGLPSSPSVTMIRSAAAKVEAIAFGCLDVKVVGFVAAAEEVTVSKDSAVTAAQSVRRRPTPVARPVTEPLASPMDPHSPAEAAPAAATSEASSIRSRQRLNAGVTSVPPLKLDAKKYKSLKRPLSPSPRNSPESSASPAPPKEITRQPRPSLAATRAAARTTALARASGSPFMEPDVSRQMSRGPWPS
mmetsp:Transcript_9189/g.23307  ORF Transcript_9189/g.23307 Transcript_9189/m.23307 type:complete len:214 (-) Transcript_9189:1654-2295(-)